MIRTRYAPSPTGYMHIGNLRSALFEYLIAKKSGGVFILRIEDTDQNRYVEGATDSLIDNLHRLNLKFDEGPGVGGPYAPYIQSERKDSYLPHALKLVESGHAYFCYCTKERLETLADERGLKKYDRHCVNMPKQDKPYVIRQLIPEGVTSFTDEVFGEISISNSEIEDQILIKSDGMPTYNFANVIDDHAMAITHVVRGSEYITSTPKYKLLYNALGFDVPVFVHLPLLQNASGQKISKRNGDLSVIELLEQGFLPEAIINYAALLGWSPGGEKEIFNLKELEEIFNVKNISKSPSTFDMQKLTWVNGEHIRLMSDESFESLAIPFLKATVKMQGINHAYLAKIAKSRVSFVKDAGGLFDFIDKLPDYDISLFKHKKMKTDEKIAKEILIQLLEVFENSQDISTSYSKGQTLWTLRTALSGKMATPCGGAEIATILGKDETIKRLNIAIKKLEAI